MGLFVITSLVPDATVTFASIQRLQMLSIGVTGQVHLPVEHTAPGSEVLVLRILLRIAASIARLSLFILLMFSSTKRHFEN